MKFKFWLYILENGGAAAGGAAAGSSSGVATSSASAPSATPSNNPGAKSSGTDTKDIAKVPSRSCCGWGIWQDPRKKKRH